MSVHITKTYNIGGLIGLRQNAVKNAGETLGFKEMSLFKFPDAYDSDDELHVRMDGIIASLRCTARQRCTGIWIDIIHLYNARRFELRIRRNHNAIFYTGMV